MAYKSMRLLLEAVYAKHTELRKNLMSAGVTDPETFDNLDGLRELLDEVSTKADQPTIDDVRGMSVGDYVKTMMPLVKVYHQHLFRIDKLTSCLCTDIEADGCVLIFIGDGKTVIRTAYDENRVGAQMGVEAILQALEGMNQVLQQGVEEYENQAGVEVPDEAVVPPSDPDNELRQPIGQLTDEAKQMWVDELNKPEGSDA